MNKLLTALDRIDDFLAWHPIVALIVAAASGLVVAVVIINLP